MRNQEVLRRWKAANKERLAEYARRYRAEHRETHRASVRAATYRKRERIRALIDAAKVKGCVDCGNRDPVVLELDHVKGIKTKAVSQMKTDSAARVLAEIDKCEVRCANCHRRATYRRRLERKHPGIRIGAVEHGYGVTSEGSIDWRTVP